MKRSVRIALAGVAGGTILTVAPIVNPFGSATSTENTRTVGVEQRLPTQGTAPVVTEKPKSSESASGKIDKHERKKTRESSTPTPSASPSASREQATSKRQTTERVTYISGYRYCGGDSASAAQPCIDEGSLVLYRPAGVTTLGGHDYKGWAWLDDLPVGRKVVIQSGGLAGTYRVYGNGFSTNKMFPANGKGADVALQTCEGNGIGFSFLRRA